MPCYDPRTDTHQMPGLISIDTFKLNERLNEVTQLLCTACQILERNEADLIPKLGLSDWWNEHKAHDKAVEEAFNKTKEVSHGKVFHTIKTQ